MPGSASSSAAWSLCPGGWKDRADVAAAENAASSVPEQQLLSLADTEQLQAYVEKWRAQPTQRIPPLLHQSWKSCTLPFRQNVWQQQCERVLAKNWTSLLWTDDDNRDFIATHYPSFLKLYDGYDVKIKRIDAVRYFYLWHFGGVYIDLDIACLQSFDRYRGFRGRPLLPDSHAVFAFNNKAYNCIDGTCLKDKTEAVPNAFMAAPPRHPFFAYAIHALKTHANLTRRGKSHPLPVTGPVFLTTRLFRWIHTEGHHNMTTIHSKSAVFNWMPGTNGHRHPCGFVAMNPKPTNDTSGNGRDWTQHDKLWYHKLFAQCAAHLKTTAMTTFWTASWTPEWQDELATLTSKDVNSTAAAVSEEDDGDMLQPLSMM